MGVVAVGRAGVGDDDRAVSQVACSARGGFDGDVGGHADEHEGVDTCQAENGVQDGAVKPVARLSPDDRFVGPGASSSMISTAGVPSRRVLASMAVRNSGEFALTPGNPGWYVTRVYTTFTLAVRNPSSSRAWTLMIPVSSARCRNIRLNGVSTSPTTPLAICTNTRADRADSRLSIAKRRSRVGRR